MDYIAGSSISWLVLDAHCRSVVRGVIRAIFVTKTKIIYSSFGKMRTRIIAARENKIE